MFSKPLFKEMFGVLIIIGVIHFLGTIYFWYWKFLWLDTPVHFLGGLCVGLATLFIASFFIDRPETVKRFNIIFLAIGSAFVVGILWEIFEYVFGISLASHDVFIRDTVTDLVFDSVGGLVAGIYGYGVLKKSFTSSIFSIKSDTVIISSHER